jgi:hypothetical protein
MKIILMLLTVALLTSCAAAIPPLIEVVEEAVILEAHQLEAEKKAEAM